MIAIPFTPQPDELIYSTIVRYHLWSLNFKGSIKDTPMDLFGRNTASAIIGFPCGLKSLCEKLPEGALTVEDIVDGHTLFPLFAPFLPLARKKQIISMMVGEKGGGIYTAIGVMA